MYNTKLSSRLLFRLLRSILLLCLYSQISIAGSTEPHYFDLALNEDTAISITQFGDTGDRILWIPSEYGINKEKHYGLLNTLAELKHEVWLADLHESYFMPPGRSSYTEVSLDDAATLIEKSLPEGRRKLFIVTTGRGAALTLLAINRWLETSKGKDKFAGIIMIHPNFQADTPTPGTAMEYLPIVDTTQLPIFIIQPEKSNKYWYLNGLVTRLTDSGSQVYTKVIPQVSDGYHARPDASDAENKIAKKLPGQISSAIHLLAKTKVTTQKQPIQNKPWKVTAVPELLQPYPGNSRAPALVLRDVNGKEHNIQNHLGKVLVLNFWATWCPPCVEEIPSLGRLQKAFSKEDLIVLSVDIGENKNDVETFLKQVPADFPVLLNPDGSTVKQWKIIAFPTTFIIDRQGDIRLAYFGGLVWDNPDVIKQLQAVVRN